MSQSTAHAAKVAMRRALKKRLKDVSAAVVTSESAAVVALVLGSPWYKSAQSISCYLSTPSSEISTDGIIRDALQSGKSLFVPFCPIEEPTVMRMLRLRSLSHFEGLKLNRWGIRELDPSEVNELEDADAPNSGGLDLILVPGLAFDKDRRRLGHGRGYYDRYITAMEDYQQRYNKKPPQTIALALNEQMVSGDEIIPTEEWDREPDILVTPSEVFL